MRPDLAGEFLPDPGVTFLNHGAFGACPRPVLAAQRRWQTRMERQPVAFLDPGRDLVRRMREAMARLAGELGAAPGDIVAQVNTTQALAVVARSLPLGPGDEIVTTDHEYAAMEKLWADVARRAGARVVVARVPLPLTDAAAFTAAVAGAFTSRTRVLFLSHVTSPTALVLPIGPAIAAARARGILSVIDGAHGPGLLPLDLGGLGADFYAGNCHKWLLAPKGTGFLHARREVQALVQPCAISHGWTAEGASPGPFGNPAFVDALEFQGTRDPTAFLAIPAAIAFRARHGWPAVMARCRDLAQDFAARMGRRTGLPPLSAPEACAPQMVALPLPQCEPAALKRALLERHGIEVPCHVWGGRALLRVSVQAYNGAGDLDRLEAALARELGL
ncbi:MAG: aminotransferase class V-fold PLP-dependent enzyme [Rhodobacteraceae bacterium]|nr:aminotransferase class V-fold PLP-dependent enzyme [Paracoccaceae bacterium]